jgi:hypothetical protein
VFHVGSRSPHSAALHSCYPRLPPSLHSQSARASPLRRQKITPLRSANFLPAPFRLKAALPALFLCFAHTSPRPPTPEYS